MKRTGVYTTIAKGTNGSLRVVCTARKRNSAACVVSVLTALIACGFVRHILKRKGDQHEC